MCVFSAKVYSLGAGGAVQTSTPAGDGAQAPGSIMHDSATRQPTDNERVPGILDSEPACRPATTRALTPGDNNTCQQVHTPATDAGYAPGTKDTSPCNAATGVACVSDTNTTPACTAAARMGCTSRQNDSSAPAEPGSRQRPRASARR